MNKASEAAKILRSIKSKARENASRENGKKGGRPKNMGVSHESNNDAKCKLGKRSTGSKKIIKTKASQIF